jgi:hypothetical protein
VGVQCLQRPYSGMSMLIALQAACDGGSAAMGMCTSSAAGARVVRSLLKGNSGGSRWLAGYGPIR